MNLINIAKRFLRESNNSRFVAYLRKCGIEIGHNVLFRSPRTTKIDLTRPCLITIGNNVDINTYFQILTHDFTTHVFKHRFGDFINSSGPVTIGNNVYFGTNVILLKNSQIGNDCIIGAGSIVNTYIPDGTVATGYPCKVICSLEDYYKRRKAKALVEAQQLVTYFRKRFHRDPLPEELTEEFIYFIDAHNINQYPNCAVRRQLDASFDRWLKQHEASYASYTDFMKSVK